MAATKSLVFGRPVNLFDVDSATPPVRSEAYEIPRKHGAQDGGTSIRWRTSWSGVPDSCVVRLQATMDEGVTWFTLDTSTDVAGEAREYLANVREISIYKESATGTPGNLTVAVMI